MQCLLHCTVKGIIASTDSVHIPCRYIFPDLLLCGCGESPRGGLLRCETSLCFLLGLFQHAGHSGSTASWMIALVSTPPPPPGSAGWSVSLCQGPRRRSTMGKERVSAASDNRNWDARPGPQLFAHSFSFNCQELYEMWASMKALFLAPAWCSRLNHRL